MLKLKQHQIESQANYELLKFKNSSEDYQLNCFQLKPEHRYLNHITHFSQEVLINTL